MIFTSLKELMKECVFESLYLQVNQNAMLCRSIDELLQKEGGTVNSSELKAIEEKVCELYASSIFVIIFKVA